MRRGSRISDSRRICPLPQCNFPYPLAQTSQLPFLFYIFSFMLPDASPQLFLFFFCKGTTAAMLASYSLLMALAREATGKVSTSPIDASPPEVKDRVDRRWFRFRHFRSSLSCWHMRLPKNGRLKQSLRCIGHCLVHDHRFSTFRRVVDSLACVA